MLIKKYTLIFILSLLTLFAIIPLSAFAAVTISPLTVTINPPRASLQELQPGDSANIVFSITNREQMVDVRVTARIQINGVDVHSTNLNIGPGRSASVSYNNTFNNPGEYRIQGFCANQATNIITVNVAAPQPQATIQNFRIDAQGGIPLNNIPFNTPLQITFTAAGQGNGLRCKIFDGQNAIDALNDDIRNFPHNYSKSYNNLAVGQHTLRVDIVDTNNNNRSVLQAPIPQTIAVNVVAPQPQVDLQITNLRLLDSRNNNQPVPNNTVTAGATGLKLGVTIQAQGPNPPQQVQYQVNNLQIQNAQIGREETFDLPDNLFANPNPNLNINVTVDPSLLIAETNENNNSSTLRTIINAPQPQLDLQISRIGLFDANNNLIPNNIVTVGATGIKLGFTIQAQGQNIPRQVEYQLLNFPTTIAHHINNNQMNYFDLPNELWSRPQTFETRVTLDPNGRIIYARNIEEAIYQSIRIIIQEQPTLRISNIELFDSNDVRIPDNSVIAGAQGIKLGFTIRAQGQNIPRQIECQIHNLPIVIANHINDNRMNYFTLPNNLFNQPAAFNMPINIDPANKITGFNWQNRQQTIPITVIAPPLDLSIRDLKLYDSNLTPVRNNVANMGAHGIKLGFKIDTPNLETPIIVVYQVNNYPIASTTNVNGARITYFDLPDQLWRQPGSAELTLTLNPYNAIRESNRDNNTQTISATIIERQPQPQIDLTVSGLSLFDSRNQLIHNNVLAGTKGIKVGFMINSSSPQENQNNPPQEIEYRVNNYPITIAAHISDNQMNYFNLPDNLFFEPQDYEITVTIDPQNKYPEINEHNNISNMLRLTIEPQLDIRISDIILLDHRGAIIDNNNPVISGSKNISLEFRVNAQGQNIPRQVEYKINNLPIQIASHINDNRFNKYMLPDKWWLNINSPSEIDITIEIDPRNQLNEANKFNNRHVIKVPCIPNPLDIAVQFVHLYDHNKNGIHRNIVNTNAHNISVGFMVTARGENIPKEITYQVNDLPIMNTTKINKNEMIYCDLPDIWWTNQKQFNLYVNINPKNLIYEKENDRINNSQGITVTVMPLKKKN